MALNLKTLLTRSLSGIVFVILLLGSVLWNYYSFSLFFFLVAMLGLNEFFNLSEKLNAKPFKLIGFISGIFIYASFLQMDTFFSGLSSFSSSLKYGLVLIPFVILSFALFSRNEKPIQDALFTLMALMYAVLPFALLNQMVFVFDLDKNVNVYFPKLVLGVIFLIWSNDTFAYLGGSLLGRHKMIERISPGKTWEGTVFGVLVTFGISFLIQTIFIQTNGLLWPMLGIAVPILATIGDLVESMLKRQAKIKDSGNIMPGHGGILDRFDSIIFVAPIVYVLFKLL